MENTSPQSSPQSMYGDLFSSSGLIKVNEKENSIYFNASIDPNTMSSLIDKLLALQSNILKTQKKINKKIRDMNEKDEEDYEAQLNVIVEPKPIYLYITSNGGWLYQVFSAIDTILSMKVPVYTVCKGFVASAGTLLSLAGKRRFITENSYMLIHELRAGSWGKYTHMAESFENSKQLMEHIKSFYLKRTRMTEEEIDEQLKKDISWNAETCLQKGLVDEIIKYDSPLISNPTA